MSTTENRDVNLSPELQATLSALKEKIPLTVKIEFRGENKQDVPVRRSPEERAKLAQELVQGLETQKDSSSKLLTCMVAAIIADTSLDYDELNKRLGFIFAGDFNVNMPQGAAPQWESGTFTPRLSTDYERVYDQTLLYLPLSFTLLEKYKKDGVFLGKVAGMVLSEVAMSRQYNHQPFQTQERFVETLNAQHYNPFKDVTLLEVGGSSIGRQPVAKLLKRCDSVNVFEPRRANRSEFLFLDTIEGHKNNPNQYMRIYPPYKFVVESRVLDQGSKIIYGKARSGGGKHEETEAIADTFAAMAKLTKKGGYMFHRSLQKYDDLEKAIFRNTALHERLGLYTDPDRRGIHNTLGINIGMDRAERILCFCKHQEPQKEITLDEVLDLVQRSSRTARL